MLAGPAQNTPSGPAISGDGSRVAFMTNLDLTGFNPDENYELFLYDAVDGVTQITRTTGSPGVYTFDPPILDGTGTRVAFKSDRDYAGNNPDGDQQLFVYDTATRAFAQISAPREQTTMQAHFAMSGDGSEFVYYYHNWTGTPMLFEVVQASLEGAAGDGRDNAPDVFVIRPKTELPALTRDAIILNGQSQHTVTGDTNPFGPEIVLDGFGAGHFTSTLVSRYRFEGSLEDVAGNNDVSRTSNIRFTQGELGQGIAFGGNGFVEIPHADDLANSGFTLSAWVAPAASKDPGGIIVPGPGNVIIAKNLPFASEADSVTLRYNPDTELFHFGIGTVEGGNEWIVSRSTYAANRFHHVAATYDGANFLRLYVNGRLEAERELFVPVRYDALIPWTIGANSEEYRNNGAGNHFRGSIDEVSFFNRRLFSSAIQVLARHVDRGLVVESGNALVYGLAIQGFADSGIEITGDDNKLTANLIGLSSAETGIPNSYGVTITGSRNSLGRRFVGSGQRDFGQYVRRRPHYRRYAELHPPQFDL